MDFDVLKRLLAALEARVSYEELAVTAVTPRMLYLMKRDTGRLKDKADAAALRQHFGLGD